MYSIAEKVILSLTQEDVKLSAGPKQIKLNLLNKPLRIGDIISVSGTNVAQKEQQGQFKELKEMMPFLEGTNSCHGRS